MEAHHGRATVSETRKLAAILVADIVGYSRLAGADEDRILARLRTLRSDLIDPILAVHHGRVVKRTGDGAIVEFRSVVDAVRCAIEVQTGLAERNAGLPPEKRIEYRVGIHVGDVVEESDGDLMGDGVNIAARLEGVANPGAICLSEQAYWQVKGRLDLKVTDLGATQLKNIAEPIHVYSLEVGQPVLAKPAAVEPAMAAVPEPKARGWSSRFVALAAALAIAIVAAGAYAWHAGLAQRLLGASVEDKLKTAPRLSIVVLPFENLSGDKEQDYFADGITDDLTTDLSHLEGSFVIARNTAFAYKGKPVDPKQLGRELRVRYALEGSVRRVGDAVAVNAQLISTETGTHIWSDRFDGERSKLGQLQVDTVARLANSLGAELVKAESLRAIRERPDNPDAVDLAMRGWASMNGGYNWANLDAAIGYFEHALRLDPGHTRAQIGLAAALVDRVSVFRGGDLAVDFPRADALLTRALSVEPDSAWAHLARANLQFARWRFDDALSELDVAIDIDRNFARAHALRGAIRVFFGQASEAIPEFETALHLSPRDSARNLWESDICGAYALLGQWDKAVEWCGKSIATDSTFFVPYISFVAACGWLGHDFEAKKAIGDLLKLRPDFTMQVSENFWWSIDPTFELEYRRVVEGLRKAGLPESEKSGN
jgi:class 3 adenylate cyclase/TolB-like protein/tetratricopeptide (TPR) repeat protein